MIIINFFQQYIRNLRLAYIALSDIIIITQRDRK